MTNILYYLEKVTHLVRKGAKDLQKRSITGYFVIYRFLKHINDMTVNRITITTLVSKIS